MKSSAIGCAWICTLALSLACSSTRVPAPAPAPSTSEVAAAPPEVTAPTPIASAEPDDAGPARAPHASPVQVLEQMLTAQALLVSLLLAPVAKDAAEAPLARADVPAPPATP